MCSNDQINKELAERLGRKWLEGLEGDEYVCCPLCDSRMKENPDYFHSAEDLLKLVEWGIEESIAIGTKTDYEGTIGLAFPLAKIIEQDENGYTLPRKILEACK